MLSNKSKPPRMRSPRLSLALLGAMVAISPAWAAGGYDASFEARYRNFSDSQTLNSFSDTAIGAGQYDQALSTLEQIIFAEPNNIEARISIARVYYHVGSFDLALGHVNEALALGQGSSFELEIIELKKLIEKADSGVRVYLDVTLGADYSFIDTDYINFIPSSTSGNGWGAFVALDGAVKFDLGTASRDSIKISGGAAYDRSFGDYDFDSSFESIDVGSGYGAISYSKGLPDVIDTLRVDLSGYGEIEEEGNGRVRRELGVRSRVSVRPTVETIIYADLGYAWLGESTALFIDNRYSYALGFEHRLYPGWTLGARVAREHTDGFVSVFPNLAYNVAHTKVDASLTHLLYVFADGKSWYQRFSGSYLTGDILDYSSIGGFATRTTDREEWQLNWDHAVQIHTNGALGFGAGYTYSITGATTAFQTNTGAWNLRARYTHRFQ